MFLNIEFPVVRLIHYVPCHKKDTVENFIRRRMPSVTSNHTDLRKWVNQHTSFTVSASVVVLARTQVVVQGISASGAVLTRVA